jgi:hypothetical protein
MLDGMTDFSNNPDFTMNQIRLTLRLLLWHSSNVLYASRSPTDFVVSELPQ